MSKSSDMRRRQGREADCITTRGETETATEESWRGGAN